jgi:dTDP-4-dehydrorhamnose reductase
MRWGISARELAWFQENPCPPQLIAIDHYVTSDRYLDEDVSRYPRETWGGNGRDDYADVDAVRVLERPGTSLRHIILKAARRYGIPIVLGEVHLGCSEDEQVRWLHEAWTTAEQLEIRGVDIRAITAWALLGCYDWDSLVTWERGSYESGAFCLRGAEPRPTAIANYVAARIARRNGGAPPAVVGDGWWRRPERRIFEPCHERTAPTLTTRTRVERRA